MKFRFLDRVVSSNSTGEIITEVTFPVSEDYVSSLFHAPGQVPFSIVLEAMAASAGRLIEVVSDDRAVALMIKVDEASFISPVNGGDRMEVRSELLGIQDKSGEKVGLARAKAFASVGARSVADASITYLCVPNLNTRANSE